MPYNMIAEQALNVQKYAEGIHCASAFFAVDDMLRAQLQMEYDTRIADLVSKMRTFSGFGGDDDYNRLMATKTALCRELDAAKAKKRFHVIYAPLKRLPITRS